MGPERPAGWCRLGIALMTATWLAAPPTVRAQGKLEDGQGEAGLIGRIAARDLAGVTQELAAGAFVGQKEVSMALRAGDPAVFGMIAERAATKPQRNDCKLILELVIKFGTSSVVDKQRGALLQEHLLGDRAPVNCTESVQEKIFNNLWTASSSAAVPMARTLLQKGLLAASDGLLKKYAKDFHYKRSQRGVEDVERYAALLTTVADSAPSLAGYHASILLHAIGAVEGERFEDISPPEKHVARTRLVRALLDKGLRLSVPQIQTLEDKARNHWTGRPQPQALQLVALVKASSPSLAADEQRLKAERALLAAFKEQRSSKDGAIDNAEGEARIAHLIRRGSNPNRIENGGEAGFDEWRYADACHVFTHLLIDRNSLEIAKAVVETYRDELLAGVEASETGRARVKGKCGQRWQFHLVEQALWPTDGPSRHNGKREPLALYLLEQGLPVKDPQRALIGAAEQGYAQLAEELIARGAALEPAFRRLAEVGNGVALNVLASAGGEPGRALLASHQSEQARAEAAREKREAEAARTRARQEAEERMRVAALAQRRKNVGDSVCMNGSVALGLIPVRVRGFVEGVSGGRIQVRVADTEGQSVRYQGTDLRQNTVLWDQQTNWLHCT